MQTSRRAVVAAACLAVFALVPAATRAQASPARDALIDDLVTANHILYRQGVVDGYGHVSARDPDRPDHFLMSRAVAPGRVAKDDIVELDLDGNGDLPKGWSTYSERFIHAEIYRARPDVMAVVHSHSPTVIPFGVTQVPLKSISHTSSFLANGAPVFEIRQKFGMTGMLIDTAAKGRALTETLGNAPVVLMRGHGDAVVGTSLHAAVSRAIYTEIDAKLLMEAMQLGGPIIFIAPEEAAAMAAQVPAVAHGPDRTWDMWKEDAERR